MSLDTELRAALEVYGLRRGALCCGGRRRGEHPVPAEAIDRRQRGTSDVRARARTGPEVSAPMHQLRILARLAADGRIELGVELADGEQILPTARHLPADAVGDEWRVSSDVELKENPIGKIRARRLDDGRVARLLESRWRTGPSGDPLSAGGHPGRRVVPQRGDRGAGGGGVRVRRMLALHQLIKIDVRFLHNVARTGELIGS